MRGPSSADGSNTEKADTISRVVHVNQEQFESEVVNSDLPVVVDFHADWCSPCRALSPILDRLAVEFSGKIKLVKVNADEEPSLADQFDVTGLPTLIMIDEAGRHEGRYSGSLQENEIRLHLQQWLTSHEVATP